MSPKEYEVVVSEIVAAIARCQSDSSAILGYGGSNRLVGASGYKHQIDVTLKNVSAVYLIECKRWLKKVGVEEVMVLASRGTDISQHQQVGSVHCVLATTVGATRNALVLAKFFNIQIEIVRSAQEFGMRIGRHTQLGAGDGLVLGDSLSMFLIRGGVVIPP
ncbi:MAG: restriction endonuclease [Pseudomarimonas sp.]